MVNRGARSGFRKLCALKLRSVRAAKERAYLAAHARTVDIHAGRAATAPASTATARRFIRSATTTRRVIRSVTHKAADKDDTRWRLSPSGSSYKKRTFTRYINGKLATKGLQINDLYEDVKDGKILYHFLEALTGAS